MLFPKLETSHLPDKPGVYRVECVATGECYVGGSANVRSRGYQHAVQLANGDHYAKAMQKAYREHGLAGFRITLIDCCELGELSLREGAWIKELNPAFNVHERVGVIRPLRGHKKKKVAKSISQQTHLESKQRRLKIAMAIEGGLPIPDAAKQFGVSYSTAYMAALYAGVLPSRKNEIDLAPLVERIRGGETIVAVAGSNGLSPAVLCRACREAGLTLKRGRPLGRRSNPAMKFLRYRDVDWSKPVLQIAKELGVTRAAVYAAKMVLKPEAA